MYSTETSIFYFVKGGVLKTCALQHGWISSYLIVFCIYSYVSQGNGVYYV